MFYFNQNYNKNLAYLTFNKLGYGNYYKNRPK